MGFDGSEATVTTNCVRHGKLIHNGFRFLIYFNSKVIFVAFEAGKQVTYPAWKVAGL